MSDEDAFAKRYLGDQVYASFDGWHIWLRTNDGISVTNSIALEPAVYTALTQYVTRLAQCCVFVAGERVRYIPGHAHGDRDHQDCEDGAVSSQNGEFVFVRFSTGDTAQACDPQSLVKL